MRVLFTVVCVALLFAGSPRLYAESTASGDDTYVLYVEQVECDASHFPTQNAVTGSIPAAICIAHGHDEMVAFQDSKVTKFPDLELVPGQQGEIDQQNPVKYPSAFDAEGKPVEFNTRGVGMKISATISGVTNSFVSLRYHLENVIGPLSTNEVEKIKAANPKLKDDKGPCFQSRNMNGDIELSIGQWVVLSAIAIGEGRYMTRFLKVEKK
jgi:hypothetical protein